MFSFQFQMDEIAGDRVNLVNKGEKSKKKTRQPGLANPLYGNSE